ncbi:MAG: hypothetical protein QOH91_2019, partial [Mycobacterium sp.]|nr:hypothetical protein [Mycobacterium sp.]
MVRPSLAMVRTFLMALMLENSAIQFMTRRDAMLHQP